ncbi:hypothetical protein FF2_042038 [Malus domestica]
MSFYSHLQKLSSQLTVVVEEIDGLTPNQMFEAANLYLGAKVSAATQRIKVNKPEKEEQFLITIDKNQGTVDSFNGVDFKWVLISTEKPNNNRGGENSQSEFRLLELSFHKKHRDMVLRSYLPYILQKSKEIKEERKVVKLLFGLKLKLWAQKGVGPKRGEKPEAQPKAQKAEMAFPD